MNDTTPEAGPSGSTSAPPTTHSAPEHLLPTSPFYSIEYPGYVKSTSISHAIRTLGGQASLDRAFTRNRTGVKSESGVLELNLRPENPFSHPITGDVVGTNSFLLKVTKKRRKRKQRTMPDEGTGGENGGGNAEITDVERDAEGDWEFVAEAVGVVPRTVRFRSMVDYQYMPDMSDPVSQLRLAMDRMDVQSIKSYTIQPEKEDYMIPADPSLSSRSPSQAKTSTIPLDPELLMDNPPSASTPVPAVSSSNPESRTHDASTSTVATDSNPNPSDPPITERSNLRLFPPPLFSRQGIPQFYSFKANPMSVITTVLDESTGIEKKRLINKSRYRGLGPASISYTDKEVPLKPLSNVEMVADQADKRILGILHQLFQNRPVWTRTSLTNQLSVHDAREIQNSKILITLVCYVFADGPWRDTLLRFGYDPREDPGARIYQRLYFRNLNHPIIRPSIISRRTEARPSTLTSSSTAAVIRNRNRPEDAEGNIGDMDMDVDVGIGIGSNTAGVANVGGNNGRVQSHIFDGVTLSKETAAFQLCDITDPMLREMIEDEDGMRDVCDERDGWYTSHALERIKTVLRHKFFSLLEGHIASEEECLALLDPSPIGSRPVVVTQTGRKVSSLKKKSGKHNMAKGAMPPEDVAAARLRATLDKNARERARRPD